MALTLEELVIRFTGDVTKLQAAGNKATAVLRKVDTQAKQTSSRISGFFTKTAAAFGRARGWLNDHARSIRRVGLVIAGVFMLAMRDALKYALAIDKLHKSTGIATQSLSKMAYAAEQEHASLKMLEKALLNLTRVMYDATITATNEYAIAFDKLGIQIKDTETGALRPVEDVFADIATVMNQMTNDTERAALSQKLFGRSGKELIPMLRLGGDAIRELYQEAERLGLVLDPELVAQAKRFDNSLARIKLGARGVSLEILEGLLPALEAIGTALTKTETGKRDLAWIGEFLGKIVTSAYVAFSFLRRGWTSIFEWGAMRFRQLGEAWDLFVEGLKRSWAFGMLWVEQKLYPVRKAIADMLNLIRPSYAKTWPEPPAGYGKPMLTFAELAEANRNAARVQMLKHEDEQKALAQRLHKETTAWADDIVKIWVDAYADLNEPIDRAKKKTGELGDALGDLANKAKGIGTPLDENIKRLQMQLSIQGLLNQATRVYGYDLAQAAQVAQAINKVYREWLEAEADPARREMLEKQLEVLRLQLRLQAGEVKPERKKEGKPGEPAEEYGITLEHALEGKFDAQLSLQKSLIGGFNQLITKTSNWIGQLLSGAASAKEAWRGFFTSLLSWFIEAITKAMILSLVSSIFGGGLGGGIKGLFGKLFGSAAGGATGASAGGGLQRGGITKGAGLVYVHPREVITPISTITQLIQGLTGMGALQPAMVGGAPAGRSLRVENLTIQATTKSGYDTRALIRDLSDYVDAELGRGYRT